MNNPVKYLFIIFSFLTSLISASLFKSTDINTTNVLLIGRDGAEDRVGERADVIVVAHLNNSEQTITLVSIPRDSKVVIPCGVNGNVEDKIAHALYYGNLKNSNTNGETCVAKTVKNLFTLSTLPYVSIGFDGIKSIVNKLGGVEVTSPFTFSQEGRDGNKYYFSKNTTSLLNGDAFLAFVRHRKSFVYGDFDRTYNQRIGLIAIYNKIQTKSNFDKVKLAFFCLTKVKTDLNLSLINKLAKKDYSNYKIKSVMISGSDAYTTSGYYYSLNQSHIKTISDLLNSN